MNWAGNDEGGAVAILVAASLVMLMGFAAITVDTGAAFSERRQEQSASDMGAMAAVQFARGSSNLLTAADNGASEAREVVEASLTATLSNADWSNCTDSASLPILSTVSPCISFTSNLQKARVVTPTIDVDTAFGGVVGVDSIATSAFAEAQADIAQAGRVMPFGLPGGSAGETEICLRTNNNTPPPCDGPDTGNFGTLDFTLFGNESQGTDRACNPNPNWALEANMAVGLDHPISTVDGETRAERDYCPIFNSRPNHVQGEPGIGSSLYAGMVGGTSSYLTGFRPGRLAIPSSNMLAVESGSPSIDNTPLWSFIDGSAGKPSSCDSVSNTAEMADCINDWRGGSYSDPLFGLTIKDATRFGAVPQISSNVWSTPGTLYGIVDIVPVYVQGTFWRCTGAGSCSIVHFPGDPGASSGVGGSAGGGPNRLNGVSAFLLDLDMLPEPLRSNFPTTAEQVDYALVK